jgi:hypothetical protein
MYQTNVFMQEIILSQKPIGGKILWSSAMRFEFYSMAPNKGTVATNTAEHHRRNGGTYSPQGLYYIKYPTYRHQTTLQRLSWNLKIYSVKTEFDSGLNENMMKPGVTCLIGQFYLIKGLSPRYFQEYCLQWMQDIHTQYIYPDYL